MPVSTSAIDAIRIPLSGSPDNPYAPPQAGEGEGKKKKKKPAPASDCTWKAPLSSRT